jgi:signal transduction histidine kinase
MRERAELLGGTLTAGPGPEGTFIVTARLPAQKRREGLPAQNGRYGLTVQKSQERLK